MNLPKLTKAQKVLRQIRFEPTQKQLKATQGQLKSTQGQLQTTQGQLKSTQVQLQGTQDQLSILDRQLQSTETLRAEYSNFAKVVRPAMAFAGGAACAYAAYNNPAMIVEGLNLFLRNIDSSLSLESFSYMSEVAAVVSYFVGSKISSVVGPAALYIATKFANYLAEAYHHLIKAVFIDMPLAFPGLGYKCLQLIMKVKDVLSKVLVYSYELAVKLKEVISKILVSVLRFALITVPSASMNILKIVLSGIYENYKLLTYLGFIGLLAYSDPYLNAAVSSYYAQISDRFSAVLLSAVLKLAFNTGAL